MDNARDAAGTRENAIAREHAGVLALCKALDSANAEIARLERIVVDLERAELRTQSELAKAISQLEATDRWAVERLEAELALALERASRYRGALMSVLESRSWKVTRPLRMARRSTRPDRDVLEELE